MTVNKANARHIDNRRLLSLQTGEVFMPILGIDNRQIDVTSSFDSEMEELQSAPGSRAGLGRMSARRPPGRGARAPMPVCSTVGTSVGSVRAFAVQLGAHRQGSGHDVYTRKGSSG